MFHRLFLVATLLSLSFIINAQNKKKEYLTVRAAKGQGVYGLLRTYNLLDQKCNLDMFYYINKLPTASELTKGTAYNLPIINAKYH